MDKDDLMEYRREILSNPPSSPFVKRGNHFSSLWKREVGRDFLKIYLERLNSCKNQIEEIFSIFLSKGGKV